MANPDPIRSRALRALAVVVAVALGVSGILAIGAYAAARMVGLTDGGGDHGTAQAAPATPSRAPSASAPSPRTTALAGDPSPTQHHQDAAQHAGKRDGRHQRRRQRGTTGVLTLHAAQTRVRPMGRVDLGGRCGCRSGTTLVVQRLEHGQWSRFPATATASGGRFHTWVMTGRRGPNQFRVVVPGGPASKPVTITIT